MLIGLIIFATISIVLLSVTVVFWIIFNYDGADYYDNITKLKWKDVKEIYLENPERWSYEEDIPIIKILIFHDGSSFRGVRIRLSFIDYIILKINSWIYKFQMVKEDYSEALDIINKTRQFDKENKK